MFVHTPEWLFDSAMRASLCHVAAVQQIKAATCPVVTSATRQDENNGVLHKGFLAGIITAQANMSDK